MPRARVLVLLAAHNGAAWIEEQLHSIANQAGVDVTVVASDDGSTDATALKLAANPHPVEVRLTGPKSPTGAAAQNFFSLIRNSPADGFDFFALSDQDDIWEPDKLLRGCEALSTQSSSGYSCAVTAFWQDGREALLSQSPIRTESDFLFEGAGQGCTFVLSKIFYARLRNFLIDQAASTASIHYHDWAIYAVSRAWGLGWTFDAQSMVRYRQHGGNDTGARGGWAAIRKRFRLIKIGWYGAQLRAIATLCLCAAPTDPVITEWNQILNAASCRQHRLGGAAFVLRGGRRRRSDRLIVLAAILAGWI
jgi:rhamnosyltransferase